MWLFVIPEEPTSQTGFPRPAEPESSMARQEPRPTREVGSAESQRRDLLEHRWPDTYRPLLAGLCGRDVPGSGVLSE